MIKDILNWLNEAEAIIIPCSSVKLPYPEKASLFYCGVGYFLHQKRVAEKLGKPWYILSTKYGLIKPDEIVSPYNLIWSKKVQQDNKSMRGLDIPIATEEHRLQVSHVVNEFSKGKRVVSFCSLHYKPYMPDVLYFNDYAGTFAEDIGNKGIQFIVGTLHQLHLELSK